MKLLHLDVAEAIIAQPTPAQQNPVKSSKQNAYLNAGLIALAALALLYYLLTMQWTVGELLRTLLGAVALWLPLGALAYVLLRREVSQRTVRLILSAVCSYSLTTLLYFSASVLGVQPLFYVALALIFVAVVVYEVRRWRREPRPLPRPNLLSSDWLLLPLTAVSLITTIHYQTPYQIDAQSGDRKWLLLGDQTYFASQAYELARGVPPAQQANEAGLPERAYHMFPHLTTALLANFSGQGDMLRAHLAYHYTVMIVLLLLLIYAIVRVVTGSTWGGYLGASLVFILAVVMPSFTRGSTFFFFSIDPLVTSGLDPVLIAAPQMLSGLIVALGVLLAVALIARRRHAGLDAGALVLLAALLGATLLRFRIQIFLALLPGLLLIFAYCWWRGRQAIYIAAGALAVVASALLYLEMRLPVYLENTANLFIAYNGLTSRTVPGHQTWISAWPGTAQVYNLLAQLITNTTVFDWTWQAISMTAFVALNMLGIPMLIAMFIYMRRRESWRQWGLYTFLTLWLLLASVLGGVLLTTSYDQYSVGGQMLLHTLWYALPLLPIALVYICRAVQARLHWPSLRWAALWAALMAVVLVIKLVSPPGPFETAVRRGGITISAGEWQALSYVHDDTPADAVIIYNKAIVKAYQSFSLYGGIGGRRTYFEEAISSIKNLPASLGPQENRAQRVKNIWAATDPAQFCTLLTATTATHLVDYATDPLKVSNPPCLRQTWQSSAEVDRVVIYQVVRSAANSSRTAGGD